MMIYPVSEIFYSIQGEGRHAGRACLFLRLAGCSVGKSLKHAKDPVLKIYSEQVSNTLCTLFDDTQMMCDTDYGPRERLHIQDILKRLRALSTDCKYVSITGGEPFIHDLDPLVLELTEAGYEVWVETSGTREPLTNVVLVHAKLVVSPKRGWLRSVVACADHLKVLISTKTDQTRVHQLASVASGPVFLQPVESPDAKESRDNIQAAIAMVQQYPRLRLSVQIHKHLNIR